MNQTSLEPAQPAPTANPRGWIARWTVVALVVTAVVLAACRQEVDSVSVSLPGTSVSTSTVPVSTSDHPSDLAWEPVLPPVAADPGYTERLGPYADMVLRGGLVPYGSEEHLNYLASCVESAGFSVKLDLHEQSLEASPGPSQTERYREVLRLCEEAAINSGLVGPVLPPTEADLALQYQAFQLTYQCLIDAGLPAPEPPSEQVYVDSGGKAWHPYTLLSPGDVPTAEALCPQDLVVLFEKLAETGDDGE